MLPNALKSEKWKENPSVSFNMISYMGVPILWPDGEVFGTFCMLDNKENKFSEISQDLLSSLQEIIQNDLKSVLLYQQAKNDILSKEVQIREVHHRIKNHFNLLISTLRLQSLDESNNKSLESTLADIQSRIAAISVVHDRLYRSSVSDSVSLGDYLNELGRYILNNLQKRETIFSCKCDSIKVPSNISVSFGLILNELITNSLKYAFDKTYSPAINLIVENSDKENITLIYKDNGSGLPGNFDVDKCKTLGMLIIKQSVLQLGGTYEIKNESGFVFNAKFRIID